MRFSQLEGARIGVWGAGREIVSFADQLARRLPSAQIVVAAFDAAPAADVREILRAPAARIVNAVDDDVVAALAGCEVVVRSPGVSIHRPQLRALREAGVPVTTATALWLAEHGGAGVIGVTGTKGKSTTAALISHLARAAGKTVQLVGNIGVPALDLLDCGSVDVTVVELSSYHTADLEIGPEVAVVTNLFKEHTDWHGSEQAYRSEKLRLLALPGVRVGVINGRDERVMSAVDESSRVEPVNRPIVTVRFGVADGWDVIAGAICRAGERLVQISGLPLQGEHNAFNLCAALTAVEALGITPPRLPDALRGFQSLPHRLQTVAERDGLLWVDDSISTTPESTLAALASFPDRALVLIGGGQDRGQDYTALGHALALAQATVIGVPSTGSRLVAAARDAGLQAARAIDVSDLRTAVSAAHRIGRRGTVVLLSPAAPSYDHYRDFEQRGQLFREFVERL
ncbi:MAG TPA: UDP-N-acetylmuramoyl-L-alanine--D-glutamate ligase [Solirubrobacteraceae bacterium]|nr:UDP-N-acetylmuramoyl-L-alanine--D-glutamate ligase [Solirubrobacteraceae bacterium]